MLGLDMSEYKLKIDHFDQVHVLGSENIIDGAPNFRQVLLLYAINFLFYLFSP